MRESSKRIKIANNRLVAADQPLWCACAAIVMMMYVAWPYLALSWMMVGIAALLLTNGLMAWIILQFWRDKMRDDHAAFWEGWFFAGSLLAGAIWGLTCSYLMLVLPPTESLLVGLIASLAIAGGSIALIPSFKFITAFSLPAILAIFTETLVDGQLDNNDIVIGVINLIFMIVLLRHTLRIAKAYRASIDLSSGLKAQIETEAQINTVVSAEYARARQILEALPVPVGLTRCADSELIYINQYGRNILGIRDLAEDPKSLKNGFIADRESRDQVYNKITKGESIHELELKMKRKDGSEFWTLFSGSDIIYDGESAILGVFPDVSQWRAAKEELIRSQMKFRLVMDDASDLITIWEPERGFTYISPSIERLLSYPADELQKNDLLEFLHPEDMERNTAANIECIKEGIPYNAFTYRIRHKYGHWEWMEASSSIDLDKDNGNFLQISTVSRLITERVQYEQALKDARERAEASDRAKSDFLAHMSHEIRTPLNAVIGFSEVMRDQLFGPLGSPRYEEYINDIYNSGTHLLALINDVLDISKVEAGNFELQEDRVPLYTIVETAMRMVKDRCQAKQIVLFSRLHAAPDLWCDRRVMIQVMLNIVGNAVKFTPERGRITIESLQNSEGCLEITITDTGIGIALEDIPLVMKQFGQVRDSAETAAAEPGTGLGLPLSKSFIEKHGGYFTLTSEPGIGTRVTITMPASRLIDDSEERDFASIAF